MSVSSARFDTSDLSLVAEVCHDGSPHRQNNEQTDEAHHQSRSYDLRHLDVVLSHPEPTECLAVDR